MPKIPSVQVFIKEVEKIWKAGTYSLVPAKDAAAKVFGYQSFSSLQSDAFKTGIWKLESGNTRD